MGSIPSKIGIWRFNGSTQNNFFSTHHDLDGKPCIANALDVEEEHVRIRLLLVDKPARGVIRCCNGDISNHRNSHIRMSF